MPKFFSVVFEVHDEEHFKHSMTQFQRDQASQAKFKGASVVACGAGDYATQAEAFEAEVKGEGKDSLEVVARFLHDEGVDPEAADFRAKARHVLGLN